MKLLILMVTVIVISSIGESVELVTTELPQPPKPYNFVITAGRAPGHTDRIHAETSDGSGVVRGMFSYIDPRQKVRTVEYVADQYGFHPVVINPVQDTKAVADAKQKHAVLYQQIAAEQERVAAERGADGDDGSYKETQYYSHVEVDHPIDTPVVQNAKLRHYNLYNKIAAEHSKLAAQRQYEFPQ